MQFQEPQPRPDASQATHTQFVHVSQGGVRTRIPNRVGGGASAGGLKIFSYFGENVAETGRGATEECFGQCTYFNRVEKLARSSWLMRMLRNTFFGPLPYIMTWLWQRERGERIILQHSNSCLDGCYAGPGVKFVRYHFFYPKIVMHVIRLYHI